MEQQRIVAIDPGSKQSAFVVWDGQHISEMAIFPNDKLLSNLSQRRLSGLQPRVLVIEQVRSYGQRVGAEIFDTVFWSGRFCEAWQSNFVQVPRRDVKLYFCERSTAKDADIRECMIQRFGAPGTKRDPGPVTYGLAKDLWQAFALAVYYWDHNYGRKQ